MAVSLLQGMVNSMFIQCWILTPPEHGSVWPVTQLFPLKIETHFGRGAECWQGQNTMSWRWGLWVLLQFWRIWRNMTCNRHRESKKVPVPEPIMDTGKARTIIIPEPTMGRGKVGTAHVPFAAMITGLTLLRSHWIVCPSDLWPNPRVSWKIRAALAVGILTL